MPKKTLICLVQSAKEHPRDDSSPDVAKFVARVRSELARASLAAFCRQWEKKRREERAAAATAAAAAASIAAADESALHLHPSNPIQPESLMPEPPRASFLVLLLPRSVTKLWNKKSAILATFGPNFPFPFLAFTTSTTRGSRVKKILAILSVRRTYKYNLQTNIC